jgi:hypothetical protein
MISGMPDTLKYFDCKSYKSNIQTMEIFSMADLVRCGRAARPGLTCRPQSYLILHPGGNHVQAISCGEIHAKISGI